MKNFMYSPLDQHSNQDQQRRHNWLQRLQQVIDSAPSNRPLSNTQMARALGTSERDLFRKIKEVTGMTPQKYIRRQRLKEAMRLLKSGTYRTVKETAFAVGYSNASYFVTQFQQEFGKKPFSVLKEEGWR